MIEDGNFDEPPTEGPGTDDVKGWYKHVAEHNTNRVNLDVPFSENKVQTQPKPFYRDPKIARAMAVGVARAMAAEVVGEGRELQEKRTRE